MRIGYADPPYPGCAHLYKSHLDYKGEVDHEELGRTLERDFDGYVLHTASTTLAQVIQFFPHARVMAWVKSFAAFKRGVPVAYAWEPVLVKAARTPRVSERLTLRDWVECPITMKRGLVGAKPQKVCHWAFEVVGAELGDDLVDLFPGTGAVTEAWRCWRPQLTLLGLAP